MKQITFVILILCVVFMIFRGHMYCEASAISDNEIITWRICKEQERREKSFYQYDATSDYVFFSYSEYDCVDVYDTNGTFQYSIEFPKLQNGTIGVRCEGDRVYIKAKNDSVLIFIGTKEIAQMTYEQAKTSKIDFSWFQHKPDRITVDAEKICWLNDSGEIIKEVDTPILIQNTMPYSSTNSLGAIFLFLMFIPFIVLLKKAKMQ